MLQISGDRLAAAAADRADPPVPTAVGRPSGPSAGPSAPAAVPPERSERSETVCRESVRPESGGPKSVRSESARPEPVRRESVESEQAKGCLYALSQPPLMLFLSVIGGLIGGGAAWDLLCL